MSYTDLPEHIRMWLELQPDGKRAELAIAIYERLMHQAEENRHDRPNRARGSRADDKQGRSCSPGGE